MKTSLIVLCTLLGASAINITGPPPGATTPAAGAGGTAGGPAATSTMP